VLAAAFLGWLFAGVQMASFTLCAKSATIDVLGEDAPVGVWFSRYQCAFLLGAALGGPPFGALGDRVGRVKAMALSIICYSFFAALPAFAHSAWQLVILRFLTGLGVGGIWPNGVALASEAWSDVSRPTLAGLIGASANVGLALLGVVAWYKAVTPESWRWLNFVAAGSLPLGILVLAFVPESPKFLEEKASGRREKSFPVAEVFLPPYLGATLLGIGLGAIPLLGGWGSTNWLIVWADKVASADPQIKAMTQIMRSAGGAVGSLFGGWLANLFGRRTTYFVLSLASLVLGGYIFRALAPTDATFAAWTFAMGVVGTVYFGWLPLYLPELFPTKVRSTGAGVSFNFGRILTAAGVLGTGWLSSYFQEDYARVGQVTSLVFALGMVLILFAPDTSKRKIMEQTPSLSGN
jgi:MFS family permease